MNAEHQRTKTALLSAHDKTGLERFASGLIHFGWHVLATSETAAYLNQRGIYVRNINETVGPPILGDKIVTLSREVHAALLADNSPKEQAELDRIGMPRIDLVYINLNPLNEEIDQDRTVERMRRIAHIGDLAMLLSAVIGQRIVFCTPEQLENAECISMLCDEPNHDLLTIMAKLAEQVAACHCFASRVKT